MITIVSYGVSDDYRVVGDLNFDCRSMPDPSPIVQDLPGTHPAVLEILLEANPMVADALDFLAESTSQLYLSKGYVGLVVFCSAGWHRSVAVAEEVARRLKLIYPDKVQVVHRGLQGCGR